jgi:tetratricopeptide (TPR) repeat protein
LTMKPNAVDDRALEDFLARVDQTKRDVEALKSGELSPAELDLEIEKRERAQPTKKKDTAAMGDSVVVGQDQAMMSALERDAQERYERKLKREAAALELKEKGNARMALGDHLGAAELYTQGLTACPGHGVLMCNRAQAYLALGRYPEAIADCEKAIELMECGITPRGPHLVKAHLRRAAALRAQGGLAEAVAALEASLKSLPENQDIARELEFLRSLSSSAFSGAAAEGEEKAEALLERGALGPLLALCEREVEARDQVMASPGAAGLWGTCDGVAVLAKCHETAKAAARFKWSQAVQALVDARAREDAKLGRAIEKLVLEACCSTPEGRRNLYHKPVMAGLLDARAFAVLKPLLADKEVRLGAAKSVCSSPEQARGWAERAVELAALKGAGGDRLDALLDSCACATMLVSGFCPEAKELVAAEVERTQALGLMAPLLEPAAQPAARAHAAAFVAHCLAAGGADGGKRALAPEPVLGRLAAQFCAMLSEESAALADFAVRGLAALSSAPGFGALLEKDPSIARSVTALLHHKAKPVRGNAALLIARFAAHDKTRPLLAAAIDPLIEILKDTLKTDPVSANACIALSRLAQDPLLLPVIRDKHGVELLLSKQK